MSNELRFSDKEAKCQYYLDGYLFYIFIFINWVNFMDYYQKKKLLALLKTNFHWFLDLFLLLFLETESH